MAAIALVLGFAAAATPDATAASTITVTGVASRSGPTTGGQLVNLVGTDFSTITGVLFGSVRATSYHRTSDHSLVVATPPHGAGRTYVRVITSIHGTSPLSEVATYIYVPRPASLANAGSAHTHSDLGIAEVSCPSATWCGAGGFNFIEPSGFGHEAGEVYQGHGWGPQQTFENDSFDPSPVSVSCVVTPGKLCQFATASGRVWRTTNGTTYTRTDLQLTSNQGKPPRLSCATSTSCTAVYGTDVYTWNGTAWSAPTHVLGAGGRATGTFNDVSCPTTTFCQAVLHGSPARVIRKQGSTWGAVETIPTTASDAALLSLTCSGPTYCLANGALAAGKAYVAWTGLAWSPPQPGRAPADVVFGADKPTLQCLSGSACVRENEIFEGDESAYFETYNGVAHRQTALPPLSCWAVYQCLVVGENSSYVTKRGTP